MKMVGRNGWKTVYLDPRLDMLGPFLKGRDSLKLFCLLLYKTNPPTRPMMIKMTTMTTTPGLVPDSSVCGSGSSVVLSPSLVSSLLLLEPAIVVLTVVVSSALAIMTAKLVLS